MKPNNWQHSMITAGGPPEAESQSPVRGPHPNKLFVETTTRCNFSCEMCLKQAPSNEIKEGDLSLATFTALEPAFPYLEALILSGIGEPLLHPDLDRFIRQAKSSMPAGSWVGFQTNGSLLDLNRVRSLMDAGLDRICLSVNDTTDRNFSASARGRGIAQAFTALSEAQADGQGNLTIGVEMVVQQDNIQQLPATLSWAASQGATFAIVTHLEPYCRDYLNQTTYDLNSDAAYRIFTRWKAKAAAADLDINQYHFKWRFLTLLRTRQQQALVDLVKEMFREAHSEKVFLHLQKLLTREEGRLGEVERTFAEAEAVAQAAGLDLRLPTLMPRNRRKCEFVEEGGAFVSWDGQVHPCYVLWHRYRSYAAGREKYISPKSFGSLADSGILEIWNEPTYQSFRNAAVNYDFPFCANCSLSPCDYVYLPEFTQDCYINDIPCGDCLWCAGLFQCLH